MSGRRSARLKAAAAKAPPAAKPAPKRTAKHKPPKSKGAPKKSKTGHTPPSGTSNTPTVGAMPAADAPPSPAQNEDLGDNPNAEAHDQPPPQPPAPPSDDEQSELVLVHVVDVVRGVEIGIHVDVETAQWFQSRCPDTVVTLADGHAIIVRLASALAFAASVVPTSVRILTVGVKLPAVMAAIQKIETAAGLKGPVPFQELLVAASQVRDDEVINLAPRDLYEYTGEFVEGLDTMPLRDLRSVALGRSALAFFKALLASPTDPVGSAAQSILAEATAANLPSQAAALQVAMTATRILPIRKGYVVNLVGPMDRIRTANLVTSLADPSKSNFAITCVDFKAFPRTTEALGRDIDDSSKIGHIEALARALGVEDQIDPILKCEMVEEGLSRIADVCTRLPEGSPAGRVHELQRHFSRLKSTSTPREKVKEHPPASRSHDPSS